jgi:hypothetical protein
LLLVFKDILNHEILPRAKYIFSTMLDIYIVDFIRTEFAIHQTLKYWHFEIS